MSSLIMSESDSFCFLPPFLQCNIALLHVISFPFLTGSHPLSLSFSLSVVWVEGSHVMFLLAIILKRACPPMNHQQTSSVNYIHSLLLYRENNIYWHKFRINPTLFPSILPVISFIWNIGLFIAWNYTSSNFDSSGTMLKLFEHIPGHQFGVKSKYRFHEIKA